MSSQSLSPELLSLIHHVELNRGGWWKKSVSQLISGYLWNFGQPIARAELLTNLNENFGTSFDTEMFNQHIEQLLTTKTLQQLPDGKLKLSEQAATQLHESHEVASKQFAAAKENFLADLHNCGHTSDPEAVWNAFYDALARGIKAIGANTYHLLVNGNLERDVDWLGDFVNTFEKSQRSDVRRVLANFFNPSNRDARASVLRMLSAYFFVEASHLTKKTIDTIEKHQKKKRTLRLVLDTNFIFSILNLHDNPANDAVTALAEISKKTQPYVDIRFYVLPTTIVEAKKVLTAHLHKLEGARYAQAASAAASTSATSGIAARYFREAANTKGGLSPNQFIEPYIQGLVTLLKLKDIEQLDWAVDHYSKSPPLIDDLTDLLNADKTRREEKQRGYDALLHDLTLWHAVKDHRNKFAESLFDQEYWAVTIDWSLIKFDHRKKTAASKAPITLHPTALIQLLQFWVPRTERLEESLMNSLRLPLLFNKFDAEDEAVTIALAGAISRFENSDDIPSEAIQSIFADTALRERIEVVVRQPEEVLAIVKEALIAQNQELTVKHAEIAQKATQLENSLQIVQDGKQKALTELAAATAEISSIRATNERSKFFWLWLSLPSALLVALFFVSYYVLKHTTLTHELLTASAITVFGTAIWLFMAERSISKYPAAADAWMGALVTKLKNKVLITGAFFIITTVVAALISETALAIAKKLLPNFFGA